MTRVNKKIVLTLIMAVIFIMTASILTISPQRSNVYATFDQNNMLSNQSKIINNVVLFTFSDYADQVKTGTEFTSDVISFVDNFDSNTNTSSNSLQAYYKAMSNGKFTIQSNLVKDTNGTTITSDDKPFVVVLDRPFDYFVAYSQTNSVGYTNSDQKTLREQEILTSIFEEIGNSNTSVLLDDSADANSDGVIDVFTFLYLDFETRDAVQNATSSSTIINTINSFSNSDILWPHRSSYGANRQYEVGSISINLDQHLLFSNTYIDISISNSNLTAYEKYLKSTYFHEMGHALALPDLYLVDNNEEDEPEYVGAWDLMGANYMQPINEYFKYKLGWSSDESFKNLTSSGTYTLKPSNYNEVKVRQGQIADLTTPTAYYIEDPNYPNQYIVLEYKDLNNANSFSYNLNLVSNLVSGLTIYRVNENYTSTNKIIDSNKTNKAGLFYFRNGTILDSDVASFQASSSFGSNESTPTVQDDINTNYISFVNEDGDYINSNLVITINSITSDGVNFTISGGSLSENTETPSTPSIPDSSSDYIKDVLVDENLLNAISEVLDDANPNDITITDLESLSELNLSNKGITDLTGFSNLHLPSLRTLILNGNKITSGLNEISTFTSITNLQMSDCGLTDISFIETLSNLNYVNFAINNITNFTQLNPTQKTNLIFVNIILNNLDLENTENAFLLSGSYDNKFAIGIQNLPSQTSSVGAKTVYFNSNGLTSAITLTLTNNSIVYNLEEGNNILSDGRYTLNYAFLDNSIAQEVNKTITFDIIVVTLKEPIVELLVGDYYENDTTASFNGWKTSYSFEATITLNDAPVEYVDTSTTGKYIITFLVKINDNTNFNLTKEVIIYDDERIAFGENGIKDEKLYIQLLTLVGKSATIEGSTSVIGTNVDNSLYTQDLYFYDINGKGDTITDLNFANKGITDLTGILLLNLGKIVTINLNQNTISDLSPLFEQGNKALPQLENLHLANMGLLQLPENIGTMYSLKKLDLSFNKLQRVDALKPLVIPQLLLNAGKTQKLELVNLNMNNLSFSTSGAWVENTETNIFEFVEDANYYEFNSFVLDKTVIPGYKSGDEIFIVLIQNLPNNVSYINYTTFEYYHTSANTYLKNGVTAYRFEIFVNSRNVMNDWLTTNTNDYFTIPNTYTVNFDNNGTNPFALSLSSKYNRKFYFSTASIKNLKTINGKDFVLEDSWTTENNYSILSTERIKNPMDTDIELRGVSGLNYKYGFNVSYVYYDVGDNTHSNPLYEEVDLNDERTYNIVSNPYVICVKYSIVAEGISNGETIKSYTPLTLMYNVTVIRNIAITIEDQALDAKMRDILNKDEGDILYSYDTYNLTRLDLSNSNISSLPNLNGTGFPYFQFKNLYYLNLSHNNLTSVGLHNATFPALSYLDISHNLLEVSSELRDFPSESNLYILATMNLYTLDISENEWLLYGINSNKTVFTGIQGITSTNTSFITYSEEVISADGSTAGFYFVDANLNSADVTYKIEMNGTYNDYLEELPTYHYNFFRYYKEAGQFTITFNMSYGEFNFRYQGVVNHGKAYVKENTYIVDYDKNNSQEEINKAVEHDFIIYENCDNEDFLHNYQLFHKGALVDNIHLDELTEFEQYYTIFHNATGEMMNYSKSILVKDREAPVLSMQEGYEIIRTLINTPYSFFESGSYDRDIEAIDNYDEPEDIYITAEVRNIEGLVYNQEYVPLNTPGTYIITYTATDSSGNVSESIIRKVKVDYNGYETIRLTKPSALLYIGDSTFEVTVYRTDITRDPDPTFFWYIDGVLCKTTKMDGNLENSSVVITSTTTLPFDIAGGHVVEVRVNENLDPDYDIVTQSSEVEYFVLLDKGVVNLLLIIAIIIIVFIYVYFIVKYFVVKHKNEKYSKYEYNIISKK
ncbi:MAG: hypothetical protein IJZ29_04195 [Clostridia bacterium]|nr:hypothetical protein [Clostridia bacterium]